MKSDQSNRRSPATVAATADHFLNIHNGAVVPGIEPATTFARDQHNQLLNPAYSYARSATPSSETARAVLTSLEGGEDTELFASGMAAVAAVFQVLCAGAHVVLPRSMYWGVTAWVTGHCDRQGIHISWYDPADAESIAESAASHGNADVVWVETPTNPLMAVTNIRRASEIARELGALLVVDNTTPTPVFCRPVELGADLVVHSATKYLNGHSDVLAGAIVTARRSPVWDTIVTHRQQTGPVLGAFESWLLARGMRTLFVRVERAANNAAALASMLEQHDKVSRVHYPGLVSHPGHAIAAGQMNGGFGALLSFEVKGGEAAALAVVGALKLITVATSLGGVETLIEHRASVEPPETGIPAGLLRLSVGIEDIDDLEADLAQALSNGAIG